MNLRLILGTKVLFDLPLPDFPQDKEGMAEPVHLTDHELQRLCAFYSMGANQKRLRVMMELARGGELRFSDVMQIATNPKLAQDCLQPMLKEGLLVHGGRGSGYRVSERALPLVLTLTLGLAEMLAVLEQELAEDAGGRIAMSDHDEFDEIFRGFHRFAGPASGSTWIDDSTLGDLPQLEDPEEVGVEDELIFGADEITYLLYTGGRELEDFTISAGEQELEVSTTDFTVKRALGVRVDPIVARATYTNGVLSLKLKMWRG